MCKHAVKKIPFVITYVPNQYRTQQMCDKAILESVLNVRKIKKCGIRLLIITLTHALKFVPDCYITEKLCDKAVDRCFLGFIYISD